MKQSALAALLTIGFLGGIAQIHAAPITFQSAENQTALVELYTSEGCSSCPPAEAWLSKLKDSPALWKDFVPVAFHVDYWDYLGWRDRWSAKEFTARQRSLARSWASGSVYTPGLVLNGSEWRDWSSHKSIPKQAGKPGVLTITSEGTNRWQVSFAPAKAGQGRYDVYAALLASGVSSDVKAGENRGRRLDHDFVVLSLVKESLPNREGTFRTDVSFAKNQKPIEGQMAIAVWVTRNSSLEPLQAVGGWLTIDKPLGKPY